MRDTRRLRTRRVVAGLSTAVLLLGATACSGGGDDEDASESGDGAKAVDALVDGMTTAESLDSVRRQNECVATGLVDTLGVDGLKDAGLITDDYTAKLTDKLDVDTATVIADQVVACWDVKAQVQDVKGAYPDATEADWDTYVACMEKLEPLVRSYAIASYTQVDSASTQSQLAKQTQRCISGLGPTVTPPPS
jgi:ABC-type phosphate/phosphonate transport system substrate-binding protein